MDCCTIVLMISLDFQMQIGLAITMIENQHQDLFS